MKRLEKLLTITLLMLFSFLVPVTIYAEPDFQNATPISVNTAYSGNVTKGYHYQQRVYRFSLSQPGGIRIQFDHPKQNDSKAYWSVELYDNSYNSIMSQDILGNTATAILPTVGLDSKVYYISVQSKDYSTARSQDVYTMTVHFDKANKYEKELNNTYTTSNLIALNTPYMGSITEGYQYEQDCYMVNVVNPGCIRVKFEHERMENADGYWNVTLYDAAYNKLCGRKIYGNTTEYNLPPIGVSAGTFFVIVKSTDYSDAKSSSTYKLTVGYQGSAVWEKELNENYSTATPIELDKTYYGVSVSGYQYEKDYYRFNVPSKDIYTISLNTNLMSSGNDYYSVALYDASYKKLTQFNLPGNVTTHKTLETLSAGTYYVCVQSTDYSDAKSQATYSISVTKRKSSSQSATHVHKPVIVKGRAATTTSTGLTKGKKCSTCGAWLTPQKVIPKVVPTSWYEVVVNKYPGKSYKGFSTFFSISENYFEVKGRLNKIPSLESKIKNGKTTKFKRYTYKIIATAKVYKKSGKKWKSISAKDFVRTVRKNRKKFMMKTGSYYRFRIAVKAGKITKLYLMQ